MAWWWQPTEAEISDSGAVSATFGVTIDNFTLSATATVTISATFSQTIADFTQAATATLTISATASQTLDNIIVSATAALPITGTFGQTIENFTQSATATVAATPEVLGGGGKRKRPYERRVFSRFTESDWESARKAFARARKKRLELEKAEQAAKEKKAARLAKQVEQAEAAKAEAYARLQAKIDSEIEDYRRYLAERRALMEWADFQRDLIAFNLRQAEEEELMIVLALAA